MHISVSDHPARWRHERRHNDQMPSIDQFSHAPRWVGKGAGTSATGVQAHPSAAIWKDRAMAEIELTGPVDLCDGRGASPGGPRMVPATAAPRQPPGAIGRKKRWDYWASPRPICTCPTPTRTSTTSVSPAVDLPTVATGST